MRSYELIKLMNSLFAYRFKKVALNIQFVILFCFYTIDTYAQDQISPSLVDSIQSYNFIEVQDLNIALFGYAEFVKLNLDEKIRKICIWEYEISTTSFNTTRLEYRLKNLSTAIEQLSDRFDFVNDKQLERILPLFPKQANYYFCEPNIPRALKSELLYKKAAEFGLEGKPFSSVQKAYKEAIKCASVNDVVYVGGSTFVVAEVL